MKLILLILLVNFSFANELIIFLDKRSPSIDLEKNYLQKIQDISTQKKIKVKVVHLKDRVPKNLKFIPSIYLQNYKGRSLYLGRYNNLSKLEKFIQTTKLIHIKNQASKIDNAIVKETENFNLFLRLKVTKINDPTMDNKAFVKELKNYFLQSLKNFKFKKSFFQNTGDRTYYFDIYPWISKDKKLFLNYAIYSQFDCHNPIKKSSVPIESLYSNRLIAYKNLSTLMEELLINEIKNSTKGDSINFDKSSFLKVSWSKMNLKLPKRPEQTDDPIQFKLKRVLTSHNKIQDSGVYFNFPAPLDHYRGSLKSFHSKLILSEELQLKDATLEGSVQTNSIDMGNMMLDETAKSYINSEKYKEAKIKITKLSFLDKSNALKIGEIYSVIGIADFTMKNKTISFPVKGEAGLIILDNKKVSLHINFLFQININKEFDISGPDSSVKGNDYMFFNPIINFEVH